MDSTQEAIADAAKALQESNQQHKRAIRYHRRALKDGMEKLRKICEAHNIKLSILTSGGKHGSENIAGA